VIWLHWIRPRCFQHYRHKGRQTIQYYLCQRLVLQILNIHKFTTQSVKVYYLPVPCPLTSIKILVPYIICLYLCFVDNCLLNLQEEVATINLAKYRKVQMELEEEEQRAEEAETSLTKLRSRNRSVASTTRVSTSNRVCTISCFLLSLHISFIFSIIILTYCPSCNKLA